MYLLSLVKGKPLQTGFVAGMETMLGVDTNPSLTAVSSLGIDATEADRQDQTGDNDQLRDRYVRSFWEPVVEGKVRTRHSSTSTVTQCKARRP